MIGDANDRSRKSLSPRSSSRGQESEEYVTSSGLADQAFFGAEAEFFIFDSIRFDQAPQHGFISSIRMKAAGIQAARKAIREKISVTGRGIRKGTSLFHPPIISRTANRKWF